MATPAQIEANRRNATRSTGPKSASGKKRASLNSYQHGMNARVIMPVLPQEDAAELEERIQQTIMAMQPRTPMEQDLVERAVRLSADIDRAERIGTAHLAHRVRKATILDPKEASAREIRKVHELGTKLFYQTAIGPGYPDATPDDYPAVIVRRLEESAEGCRWLLEQWAQLLNVMDATVPWGDPEVIRFCGLLGKRGIEAHFDPELNALFQAFDAIAKGLGQKFWTERRDHIPLGYYGGFQYVNYRIITAPPRDKNEAMVLICTSIEKNVGRLEKLLKDYEAIEAEEADERYDRAALDCSRAFERHRRYQSARTRELLRVLEEYRRMRKEEFGEGMADGKWQMTDGKCQMEDDGGEMTHGKCQMTDGKAEATDLVVDWVVGHDSSLVTQESTNDKSGILSHEEADRTRRAESGEHGLSSSVAGSQKAQNEANLRSTQVVVKQPVKSHFVETSMAKRTQIANVAVAPDSRPTPHSTPHAPLTSASGFEGTEPAAIP